MGGVITDGEGRVKQFTIKQYNHIAMLIMRELALSQPISAETEAACFSSVEKIEAYLKRPNKPKGR